MTQGSAVQRIKGYCALCWSSCGCVSVVEDGKLVAVEPNPEHPTGHALCAKGRAAPELVHHKDRLLHPLRRTNPKGAADPGWQPISWDEALDTIASELRRVVDESGREAVAFGITTPAGTAMQDGYIWVERLRNAFGSPNVVASSEVCDFHSQSLNRHTFGSGLPMVDFDNTGCIILWGHNASMTWIAHGMRVAKAKARGAKLVVIDPRRAGLAAKADQWLQVRPGTDGALALGLAGILIEKGWYDREFVREWTNGPLLVRDDTGDFLSAAEAGVDTGSRDLHVAWDERRNAFVTYDAASQRYDGASSHLALTGRFDVEGIACRPAFDLYAERCRAYPPERVEAVTWVPASQVMATAELLAKSGPVSLSCWAGLEQHTNATETSRAVALLYALTGSFDAKGGNVVFENVPLSDLSGGELFPDDLCSKTLMSAERPLGPEASGYITSESFYEAVLTQQPYAVKALVNFGPNLIVSHANAARGAKALESLDFMVAADLFMTPTTAHADIVLPVNTPWERDNVRSDFAVSQEAVGHVQYRKPVLEPAGESRSDAWIVFALAERLGLGDHFWHGDLDAAYRALLDPSDLDLDSLKSEPNGITVPLRTRYRKYASDGGGFATPSGKIEIYAQAFLDHGYDPLPGYTEPALSPESRPEYAKEFPLILTTAKTPHFLQSQMRGLSSLRRAEAQPRLEIHPGTASTRGIDDGDWVIITTPHGATRATAHFSDQIDKRVVSATHGWWQGCEALGEPGYDAERVHGANVNALFGRDLCDRVSGSVPLKSYLCQVLPAQQET